VGKLEEHMSAFDGSGDDLDPPNEDWLTTYADAITLLMAFFVLMFSISEIKQEKFLEFTSSIDAALGDRAALGMPTPEHVDADKKEPTPYQGMADNMEGRLHELMQRGEVTMAQTRKGVYMDVHTDNFYEAGGFTIRPEMRYVLDSIISELRPRFLEDYKVEIIGHTDDTPINSAPIDSNWDLSAIRSAHIARYMVEQGIEPRRIKATGMADADPLVPNRNADGTPNLKNRAENRRVQIKIEY
jgi:chemotaxis protein MotB